MKEALRVRRAVAPLGSPYPHALVPADDAAAEAIGKIELGDAAEIRIVRRRSTRQNRLYWGALSYVAEATKWESAETLHECLKVRLGYFTTGKTPDGRLVVIPKSTAFDNMTHEEFCAYMEKALDTICVEILGGYDKDRLIEEVKSSMGESRIGHNRGPAM